MTLSVDRIKPLLGGTLGFLGGAALISICSVFQDNIDNLPIPLELPTLRLIFGGLIGLLLYLRETRLRNEIKSRIKIEKKLKESEERQRTIIEHLGVGIMVMDPTEHKVVLANREASRMIGMPSDQIVHSRCYRFFANTNDTICPFCDSDQKERPSEHLLMTAEGEERSILKSIIHIKMNDQEHHLVGFIDNFHRKRAEDNLRHTVERFKTLTDDLNVGFFRSTSGGNGRFIEINPSIYRMLGYETEEALTRKTISSLYEDPDHRKVIIDRILAKGVIKNEIVRLKKKDSSLLIGSLSASLVNTTPGQTPFIDGILEDVTERELIGEKLLKSKQRYKELFNSVTDLIYTQDLDGRFTSANSALYRLFGYTLEEFLGRKTTDFMKPEHATRFKTQYLDRLIKDGNHEGVSSYLKKDGSKIYLEFRSSLVRPKDGEAYISGIARDVTDRIGAERKIKTLQNQMLQVQKMEAIGTLAGGIAHDFNNILSAVIGYTELALLDVDKGSHIHKNLTEVLKAGRRASDLVKQILTFSRQSKHEVTAVHINPLVKEALKMLRSTIPTSIDIQDNIHSNLLTMRAEPTHIHQVIVNLVANAAQAVSEEVGKIEIALEQMFIKNDMGKTTAGLHAGEYAKLTVKDNGEGISRENLNHIFEPYFTTKEQLKGTGLGLAVVHGIVETYKGQVDVTSEINKGTMFEVYFPLDPATGVNKASRWATGPLPVGNERILLVDDEPSIVDIQKQVLKLLGYNVTDRVDSSAAFEEFRKHSDKFDLVITDMTMPVMSGKTLANKIKAIRPDIPVILCTGFSDKFSDPNVTSDYFDGFLLKPVDKAMMAKTIRKVLKNKTSNVSLAASA